ncbi:MAG: DNA gyrase/topoisomerase IV subunit A [Porphyromonas sp.]|nr:DNA gyrase/topoisomerase IV subunit A [Porphyromonas sp.]
MSQREVKETKHNYILTGMYKSWFLSYASYVILERAVPHITDGLKPVQRRILYTMSRMDDRLIKVANIVGYTMQLHPHGDASIGDALVQIGQKDLLIDCQGNWGNILTGDGAAAARYIEARLLPFAKKVLFSHKITEYKPSYDGANMEPVHLPVKFPLLLAQGAEGIAVGLSSKILPHNVKELLQAAVSYLNGEEFTLYPDFSTGGLIDISRYNDGERGGALKVRASIIKKDNRTLVIDEIPFSRTTSSLIESILKANEKGKIKIRKIDDKTAERANIEIQLASGSSPDKTIDALYAFTDCEISISPNCCVIRDDKPDFLSVSEVLKDNCERTMVYLRRELEIQLKEVQERHLAVSLEQLFIKMRIYKDPEFEQAKDLGEALFHIRIRLKEVLDTLIREVTDEDLKLLLEIRMARILRFNEEKSKQLIKSLEAEIKKINSHLKNIRKYTINWYQDLLDEYGDLYPRRSKIQSFDSIEAVKVVEMNEKLYVNKQEGFIGTALKKDEFVCNVSSIDDVIVFLRDGSYTIVKVAEKSFVGKDIIHVARFVRNDSRTIYNVIYKDGKSGINYIKRFNVTSVNREKVYDLTMGTTGSRILYFSANPNGEAETVKVVLKPKAKQKQLVFEKDFSQILIKGRGSKGNILTKGEIYKVSLKQKGSSTLGGRMIWFDSVINRVNYDERGEFLGEFLGEDRILVILQNGECYTTSFAETNHYERDILIIEKYDPEKVWTLIYLDKESKESYIKRFVIEENRRENMLMNPNNELLVFSDEILPRFEVALRSEKGNDSTMILDADEFVGIRSIRVRGKRVSSHNVIEVKEIDPKPVPILSNEDEENLNEAMEVEATSSMDEDIEETFKLIEEVTGQQRLNFNPQGSDTDM